MSAAPSVLYDTPGPKALRRHRIISVVSVLVFVVLLALAGLRLNETGQFEADLWAPLYWPGDDQFLQVWGQLRIGIQNTLLAAALAIVFSLVLGTVLTTLRLLLGRYSRLPLVLVAEVLRGAPVVILIFFAARVLPQFGVDLSQMWYLVIGLTAYNFVVIGEILRAGVAALPRGQREAGLSIGLTPQQTVLLIQMPQSFRLMLPALISQLVVIVKDTSLAAVVLIGPLELLNAGRRIERFLDNPLQTYLLVALLFILINSLLGRLATYTERRLSASRGSKPDVDQNRTSTMANVGNPGGAGGLA
ncbi:amino acid ABC transporter permease [Aquipuribacter sp. MA13-6]|uniref:amino acid ABC transporter permease n=1 Tax=unclassified Aquipuribacter TaxID=2635084 RepID=UPI003EEBC03B